MRFTDHRKHRFCAQPEKRAPAAQMDCRCYCTRARWRLKSGSTAKRQSMPCAKPFRASLLDAVVRGKGICFSAKSAAHTSLGQRQDSDRMMEPALKARFNASIRRQFHTRLV